jgi:hypothetical protein
VIRNQQDWVTGHKQPAVRSKQLPVRGRDLPLAELSTYCGLVTADWLPAVVVLGWLAQAMFGTK